MELLATRDSWWMTQCEAALLSEQIPARWEPLAGSRASLLDVPVSDAARAADLLSELLGEELARRQMFVPAPTRGPLLLQPAFAVAIVMALLTIAFFFVTGGLEQRSDWYSQGAVYVPYVLEGQWWRLITGATLHSDVSHALGNAGFFLVLMWAAAERLGSGVGVTTWLVTAVLGFVASLLFGDATLTVGASGGLFGLLGAAGAHAYRHRRRDEGARRGLFRTLGGSLLLLAFTAFSPRANIAAHVGGFLAGLVFGFLMPARPAPRLLQALCVLASFVTVWAAWALAREAG